MVPSGIGIGTYRLSIKRPCDRNRARFMRYTSRYRFTVYRMYRTQAFPDGKQLILHSNLPGTNGVALVGVRFFWIRQKRKEFATLESSFA